MYTYIYICFRKLSLKITKVHTSMFKKKRKKRNLLKSLQQESKK